MGVSRPALVYKGLIGLLSMACLVQSYWLCQSKPAQEFSLQSFAYRLRQAGLSFRVVSDRQDGLLIENMFLTQSDLADDEIRSLAIDPTQMERWRGTVKVFYEPSLHFTRWIGEDNEYSYRHGPYLMFGDGKLLKTIKVALESPDPEDLSIHR
jgi:hypothetical protein